MDAKGLKPISGLILVKEIVDKQYQEMKIFSLITCSLCWEGLKVTL